LLQVRISRQNLYCGAFNVKESIVNAFEVFWQSTYQFGICERGSLINLFGDLIKTISTI
jgi:hypothetical protein